MEADPTLAHTMAAPRVDPGAATVVNARIGSVTLGAKLGEGGMASVFEGLDHGFSPPRRVAVKLMDKALSNEPEFRKRFEREASLVGDFRHHHIVRVYASGEAAGGLKFIVMEYLAGGTLAQRLESQPPGVAECLEIAAAMAGALAYSHARGVVHRDFKPANIMFTAEGQPVLTDFGVAKNATSAESQLTRHAMYIGAPRYMSPEQERAEEVTDRADLYALGITLAEMLTGKVLPPALRAQRDASGVAGLRALLPPVTPPGIAELMNRCLQFDPVQRPTAAQALAMIEAARAAMKVPVSANGATVRRRGMRWGIGALVLATAAAGSVYMLRNRETAAPAELSVAESPVVDTASTPVVPADEPAATASVVAVAAPVPARGEAVQTAVRRTPAPDTPSQVAAGRPTAVNPGGSAEVAGLREQSPQASITPEPVAQSFVPPPPAPAPVREEAASGSAMVQPVAAAVVVEPAARPDPASVQGQPASSPPTPPPAVVKPAGNEKTGNDNRKSNSNRGYVPPAF